MQVLLPGAPTFLEKTMREVLMVLAMVTAW